MHEPATWAAWGVKWENDALTLAKPDARVEAHLDREFTRVGPLRWVPKTLGPLEKVVSFVSAVTSGKANPEVAEERLQLCQTCPKAILDQDGLYCGACGCGRWQLSRLDGGALPKLGWNNTRCPLRRW